MIRVQVYQLNPNRLAKLKRELGYLSGPDFLKTVPLKGYEREIQAFMKEASPDGENTPYLNWLIENGAVNMNRSGWMKFADAWRTRRETDNNKVGYKIWSLLETVGGKRGQAKFSAIEYGSSSSTWIAKRAFHAKTQVNPNQWMRVSKDQQIEHKGNEGADVIGKTTAYIQNVMLPKVRAHVSEIVKRRMQ